MNKSKIVFEKVAGPVGTFMKFLSKGKGVEEAGKLALQAHSIPETAKNLQQVNNAYKNTLNVAETTSKLKANAAATTDAKNLLAGNAENGILNKSKNFITGKTQEATKQVNMQNALEQNKLNNIQAAKNLTTKLNRKVVPPSAIPNATTAANAGAAAESKSNWMNGVKKWMLKNPKKALGIGVGAGAAGGFMLNRATS